MATTCITQRRNAQLYQSTIAHPTRIWMRVQLKWPSERQRRIFESSRPETELYRCAKPPGLGDGLLVCLIPHQPSRDQSICLKNENVCADQQRDAEVFAFPTNHKNFSCRVGFSFPFQLAAAVDTACRVPSVTRA
jgi:hypothetical protein